MGINLVKFYQDNNFKKDGKLFFGLYRGKMLSIIEGGNYLKASIAFNESVEKEVGRIILNKISEIKASNRILQRGITTNVGIDLFFYQAHDIQTQFFIVLNKIYDELDKIDLKTCDICPLCGKNMPSDSPFFKLRDTMVIQAHNECIDYTISLANKMGQQLYPDSKKAMLKYLLGSTILMLVITAIFILLSLVGAYNFIAIISGWLFLFVNEFIMFKLKTPKKIKYIVLNIVFAVILSMLVTFFGSLFNVSALNDITIADVFTNLKEIFALNNYQILKYMLTDFGLSLAFIAFNSFFVIKRVKDTAKGTKKIK